MENQNAESKIWKVANATGFDFQGIKTNFSINNLNAYVTDLNGESNCNCGSVIGKSSWEENKTFDLEKERKKLERKKFSKRRIEELLIQKEQNLESNKLKNEVSENSEAKKWIAFLKNLHTEKVIDKVGILFHQYQFGIAEEIVKIRENHCDLKTVNIELLKNMKEDSLLWVKL